MINKKHPKGYDLSVLVKPMVKLNISIKNRGLSIWAIPFTFLVNIT